MITYNKVTIEDLDCPKCGKVENQVKMGYNRSGTQRCMCKECGTRYTIAPKTFPKSLVIPARMGYNKRR